MPTVTLHVVKITLYCFLHVLAVYKVHACGRPSLTIVVLAIDYLPGTGKQCFFKPVQEANKLYTKAHSSFNGSAVFFSASSLT